MKTNAPGAVASLVCGIISIVLCWVPIVGLVLGIIAIVAAGKAKGAAQANPEKFEMGGVRVGGFVCGIIGTVLSAIQTVSFLLGLALIAGGAAAAAG